MKILVFDNYDSFTYNLVHLVQKITGIKVEVFRNDEIPMERVADFDKIILSPGPGVPKEAGLLVPLIKEYASAKPMLGVCLGHQAIGEAFGANLINLSTVYHGVATPISLTSDEKKMGKEGKIKSSFNIRHSSSYLFEGLPEEIEVGRYHSWVIADDDQFPNELEITARDANGYIMALQHKKWDVQGVQFHPESVLTPEGEAIIKNWLKH